MMTNNPLIGRTSLVSVLVCLSACLSISAADRKHHPLRLKLKDEHAAGADFWVYNDLASAFAEARRVSKPLFVTFRCVPCGACAGFDAEVAKGNEGIRELARENFVAVRQVEMKGVDLSQFQFDYDLNWAAMFLNADGTVYGRYGTQSAAGPDAYNSIGSLEKAMQRVLELHAAYPENAASLAAKRGPSKPYATALEMPGLRNREKLRGLTARDNCIHCHNVHDAEQAHAAKQGALTHESLWRYPLPENVGLTIDPGDGCRIASVEPNSPAFKAGLQPDDVIAHVDGQAIISIADMQWVLHHLSNGEASVTVSVVRDGQPSRHTLRMPAGWKKTDISWRGSMWSLDPKPGFWGPVEDLSAEQQRAHDLPANAHAFRVRWINQRVAAGRAAHRSGLREGDLVLRVDDKPVTMTTVRFNTDLRLHRRVGDQLKLTVLRDGETRAITLPLVASNE